MRAFEEGEDVEVAEGITEASLFMAMKCLYHLSYRSVGVYSGLFIFSFANVVVLIIKRHVAATDATTRAWCC